MFFPVLSRPDLSHPFSFYYIDPTTKEKRFLSNSQRASLLYINDNLCRHHGSSVSEYYYNDNFLRFDSKTHSFPELVEARNFVIYDLLKMPLNSQRKHYEYLSQLELLLDFRQTENEKLSSNPNEIELEWSISFYFSASVQGKHNLYTRKGPKNLSYKDSLLSIVDFIDSMRHSDPQCYKDLSEQLSLYNAFIQECQ